MLVTHAPEGVNLDHDAVAFAVQATAMMLPRFVQPRRWCCTSNVSTMRLAPEAGDRRHATEHEVRVDFGADSRRLKEQILIGQLGPEHGIDRRAFKAEFYRPQNANEITRVARDLQERYHDAPEHSVGEFRSQAAAVLRGLAHSGMIASAII